MKRISLRRGTRPRNQTLLDCRGQRRVKRVDDSFSAQGSSVTNFAARNADKFAMAKPGRVIRDYRGSDRERARARDAGFSESFRARGRLPTCRSLWSLGTHCLTTARASAIRSEQTHRRRCPYPQRLRGFAPRSTLAPLLLHLLRCDADARPPYWISLAILGWRHRTTSIVSPRWSQGASVRSCLTPKYRSVVVTEACPRLNWICSRAALPLCANLANVRRRS